MKYNRFEELPVWQAAIGLAVQTYELTGNTAFAQRRSLCDQIERAAVSVSNNIAEGFERGTTNELLHFLYIARGSAGEVRSMLCLFERMSFVVHLKREIAALKVIAESCSKQLRAWADSLQNSDIKGQRHLNDKVRQAQKRKQEDEEFTTMLLQARENNIRRTREYWQKQEAEKSGKSESEEG